ARTSSRSVASCAASRISRCTWASRAFIFGRSSRIVPTPSATSRRTNSPMPAPQPSRRMRSCSHTRAPRVRPDPSVRDNRGMDAPTTAAVWPGSYQPLGATWGPEATNFAVHAPDASRVEVCLFDVDEHGVEHERRLRLTEYTLGIWHGAVPGVPIGQRYGFRTDGTWDPDRGRRFNPAKLLLDPYARSIAGSVRPGPEIFDYVLP